MAISTVVYRGHFKSKCTEALGICGDLRIEFIIEQRNGRRYVHTNEVGVSISFGGSYLTGESKFLTCQFTRRESDGVIEGQIDGKYVKFMCRVLTPYKIVGNYVAEGIGERGDQGDFAVAVPLPDYVD